MADADLSGTVLDGRYKVIEPIAEGAMGSVYRAERVKLGRAVAIKIMHHELPDELASRQRFEREAKLMALLEHPNCVSVIDFGVHDDKPFLVMDLVRGTSLLDVLDKTPQLEVARAADIIRQVLSGLAHAHELGIVHRDIKPANIMISEKAGLGQQVRILDFGLARPAESSTKLTTGIVVGTPNYMAPEQCKGTDVDARTDLYACGVMLFEMLTGRKPFVADDPIQVVRKHLLEAPPTLSSVEPRIDFGDLEGIVAKALAKTPDERFASAVEMSKAVEAAAAKHSRTSAAALFARAIPQAAEPAGNQVATMSGWNVPASAEPSGAGAPAPSGAVAPPPQDPAAPGMAPPPSGAVAPGQAPPASGAVAGAPVAAVGVDPASAPATPVSAEPPTGGVVAGGEALAPSGGVVANGGALPPSGGVVANGGALASGDVAAGAAAVPSEAGATHEPGAPSAPLAVPPTRPVAARASGTGTQPPFTKKQLMIGGGGLLAVIVLIAIVASGSDDTSRSATPGKRAGAIVLPDDPAQPEGDAIAHVIERATAMIERENYGAAANLLRRARKQHPKDAQLAFLAGKAYFGQLYWSDGIENFRAAIELDASYRENPELLKTVLKGFLTTPDVDERITSFMRHDIGPPLRAYLEETAEKHPRQKLRDRARAELDARP